MKIRSSKAFTMMEMMVVLLIIGFIAAMVIPQVTKYMQRAGESKMQLRMSTIKAALMSYRMDFGVYPSTREGLSALIENPRPNDETYRKFEREGRWPYIVEGEKGIADDNGNEFTYNNPPEKFKDKYRSYEIIWVGRGTEEEPQMDIGE
ncbi:MAG: type II secretion system protein GspG [Candidatus Babeliales bacterium]